MTEEILVNSKESYEEAKKYIAEQYSKHHYLKIKVSTGKQRTLTQNAALHVYCKLVSEALNAAGYDFREFIEDGFPVPFNERLVKDNIWRTVQKAMLKHESTTDPERHEYSLVYDVVNLKLSEYGIHVPWPVKK